MGFLPQWISVTMADAKNIKTDEICDDPKIAELKEKQMEKFKKHSMLNSIAETTKFLAGVLITVGMAIALPEFVAAVGAGFAGGIGISALGIGLIAAAAVATGIAIFASYKATNIWTDGQFNNYEISAKSTAHHLVQEIESHNMCLTEKSGRTDGKSWCQVAAEKKAAMQQAQSL
jgi:hypothetical protein